LKSGPEDQTCDGAIRRSNRPCDRPDCASDCRRFEAWACNRNIRGVRSWKMN